MLPVTKTGLTVVLSPPLSCATAFNCGSRKSNNSNALNFRFKCFMGCCFWIVKLIVSLAFIDSWYFFATNITKRQHTPNNYQKINNTTYIFFYHPVFAPRQVAILTLDIGYTFIAGRTAASAVASRRIRTCAKRRAIYIRNTLAGRASAKSIEWHDMRCVILFIMQPLHRKLLRALPYWACGR